MVKKDEQEQEIEEITEEDEIEDLEKESMIPDENPTESNEVPLEDTTEAVEGTDTGIQVRYAAYKQKAVEGIIDRETGTSMSGNTILAKILNEIEEIKKTTG